MTATELKAIVFAKLTARGITVRLNHRVPLSGSVKGYQRINLDIVALDKEGNPFLAIYIGPRKERKLLKYKLTKVQFLELSDKDLIADVVEKFLEIYISKWY
jgi:hypothetical protein